MQIDEKNKIEAAPKLNDENSGPPPAVVVKPWMIIAALAVLFFAGIVLYLVNPAKHSVLPPCVFNKLTGMYCPGCGATRAVHSLLHGEFRQAMAFNGVILFFLAAFGVWFAWNGLRIAMKKQDQWPNLGRRATRIIFAGLIIYFILRNIPVEPFTWLAPHEISPSDVIQSLDGM